MAKAKRPRDTNQLAKHIVDVATGERKKSLVTEPVNEFARAGGHKGGRTRAASLSPEQGREIARKAAQARWSHTKAVATHHERPESECSHG